MNEQKCKSVTFTPQHKLEDAENAFSEAIYRFRKAEDSQSADFNEAKLEMFRREKEVRKIREHIYRGEGYKLFEHQQKQNRWLKCPKPEWV